MKYIGKTISLLLIMAAAGCDDRPPMVSLGVDSEYVVARMKPLVITPRFSGRQYTWSVATGSGDSVVSREPALYFVRERPGSYSLRLEILDGDGPVTHSFTVRVVPEEIAYSRYIDRVVEYRPAPGQFVNVLPEYAPGDDSEAMRLKAEECVAGKSDGIVSLGGFGGYIVFAFDHTVVNVAGANDFKINGNAFYSAGSRDVANAEPGIVMVARDINANGLADDPWYELAGSEYHAPATMRGVTVTYTRPDGSGDVPWTLSDGTAGVIPVNAFHRQEYYPKWIADSELSFTATLLPPNATRQGANYILRPYAWGYADSYPNDDNALTSFDIGRAVDADGNPVRLDGVDFIKVYTAVNQVCGWLGETSTEISRAEDLHIDE